MANRQTRAVNSILKGKSSPGTNIIDPPNMRYRCFPLLAGAGVTGIPLTIGAGPAWSAAYGVAWTTIANAAGADITTEFFVVGLYVYTAVALTTYEIQMSGSAAPATIADVYAEFKFEVTAITCNLRLLEVGPYPIWQPQGQLVAARVGGDTAAKAINVHLYYALGL